MPQGWHLLAIDYLGLLCNHGRCEMTAILSLLASKAGTYLIGAGGVLLAVLATYMRGRLAGAKLERQKQAAEEARARDIADQVQNDVGALTPAQARERLGKWAR